MTRHRKVLAILDCGRRLIAAARREDEARTAVAIKTAARDEAVREHKRLLREWGKEMGIIR